MRLILPLLFGLGGVAVLVALGLWQLQRLDWKEGVLAEIEARIAAAPVGVPAAPDPEADRFLPVVVSGGVTGSPLRVLVSEKGFGAGYRLIYPYRTEFGRDVMVDLGVIAVESPTPDLTGRGFDVTGNLHWPDEVDAFTPAPDEGAGLRFDRDVPQMAAALGTEPVLVVARATEPQVLEVRPIPIATGGIPNNHLGYAIQWFGLAAVWAGMTAFLLWRIRRRTA